MQPGEMNIDPSKAEFPSTELQISLVTDNVRAFRERSRAHVHSANWIEMNCHHLAEDS